MLAKTAVCFSKETFTGIGLFNTSINITTDVIFTALPIPIIWGLNLNKKTRLSLILVLSLGFFACAASMVKLSYQVNILFITNAYRWYYYSLWNTIEIYSGIIAASLPSLRPLLKAVLDSTRGFSGFRSSGRARYGQYGGNSGKVLSGSRHKFYRQEDSIGLDSIPKRESMARKSTVQVKSTTENTESEDSIVEDQLPMQGIMKTTDFSVTAHAL
jgi:hypothetical protein